MPSRRVYMELRISKLLGVLPYSSRLKFSGTWAIYSIFLALVTTVIEMYRIVLIFDTTPKNLTVSLIRSIVKLNRIAILIIQISTVINSKREFEAAMKTLTDPESKRINKGRILMYASLSAMVYCVPRLAKERLSIAFPPLFFWCTNELSNVMVARQFCIIITIIRKRVSKATKMMLSPTFSSRLTESLCEKLEQCLAVATKANDFYSLQLLAILIYIFLKFLDLTVEIILYKRKTGEQEWLVMLLVFGNAFHTATLVILLITLMGVCENTSRKVNEFHSALFKTMAEHPSLRANEWLNLYVEMSPTIEFTACHFFTIRNSLVTSVVAAALTYLIIIVQFNDGS